MEKTAISSREGGTGAIRAIVGSVIDRESKYGYVVTFLQHEGSVPGVEAGESITFSLVDWQGPDPPRNEQMVELYGVRRFRRGLRAGRACPVGLVQPRIEEDRIEK